MREDRSIVAPVCALVIGSALAAGLPAPGLAQNPEYSKHPMVVQYDVGVPARDGVRLSADIYRPLGEGQHPTIFQATPYNNNGDGVLDRAWGFVRRGYAYVVLDVRGRYDSEGEFFSYRNDGPDGSDAIFWIARQDWSDGKVATYGGSYGGKNQWLMAKENNPHHAAISATTAAADEFHDTSLYNGVPKLDLRFTWLTGMYGRVNQTREGWNWPAVMRYLPLNTLDAAVGRNMPNWRALVENVALTDWWQPAQVRGTYETFDIPSWVASGWFDGQLRGAVQNHREAVRTASRPADHVLIIGPWLHGLNRNQQIGERDYGPEAIIELDRLRDEWLDHRLLGRPQPDVPNVLYFIPVRNEWRAAHRWPVPGTRYTQYYLDSRGRANTLSGDGVLGTGGPGRGPADEFRYDPEDPVPTVSSRTSGGRGGLPQGSVDNRSVETRQDVLVYTTPPLAEGLEITGPVTATIWFSTDVPDTDITVKLLDVQPGGRALNVSHGIARARYRDSYSSPEFLEPGAVYAVEVELFPTANYFAPGHCVRIEVSSSDFPNFARNLNTRGNPNTTTEMRVATTRIHHSAEYPSHIVLPVIPSGTTRRWQPTVAN